MMTERNHLVSAFRRRVVTLVTAVVTTALVLPTAPVAADAATAQRAAVAGTTEARAAAAAGPDAAPIEPTVASPLPAAPVAATGGVRKKQAGAALVSTPTGGYWVFAVKANGHIFQMIKGSGRWTAAHDLGGTFRSAPAATYRPRDGRIDVFAVSTGGWLKTRIFEKGRWTKWYRVAKGFVGGLSAVRTASHEVRVFGRGTDGRVRTAVRSYGSWRTGSLGGTVGQSTAAVYHRDARAIQLFAVGPDGRVRHRNWRHGSWGGWHAATVATAFTGVAATRVAGTIRVYVVHRNGTLYEFGRGKGRWTRPMRLGGRLIGTPGAAVGSGEIRIVGNNTRGQLTNRAWHRSWSNWHRLPAPAAFPTTVPARVRYARTLLGRWGGRLTGLPGVRSDLQATAAGRAINNASSCHRSVHLDATMLRTIIAATNRYRVFVNNMVSGHGCDSGFHPRGKAVDFNTVVDPATGRRTNWHSGTGGDHIGLDVEFLTHVAAVVKTGGGAGQSNCAGRTGARLPAGMLHFADFCNHQHLDTR